MVRRRLTNPVLLYRAGVLQVPQLDDRFLLIVWSQTVNRCDFYTVDSFAARSSRMTSRSLLIASFTSSSPVKLKAALTYAVFLPFGKNAVPGRARTPRSSAFVRIILSESPAPSCSLRSSLNLLIKKAWIRHVRPKERLIAVPEEHPSLR